MNTTNAPACVGTPAASPPPMSPAGTGPSELDRLAEPFPVDWLHFKPEVVKGNRALAVAYLNARDVQDRLDAVLGPANWKTEYTQVGPASVECKLSVRIAGEWVGKSDVGSFSEQKGAGDQMKAAYSDALKRAAVQWGVGRYLYQLAPVWCGYDMSTKQFTDRPTLPAWARPKAITHTAEPPAALPAQHPQQQPANNVPAKQQAEMPKTGAELLSRLTQFEAAAVARGACKTGELIGHVSKSCEKAGYASQLAKLDGNGIAFAVEVVKDWNASLKARQNGQGDTPSNPPTQQQQHQKPAPPPKGNGNPNAAAVGVRRGILNTIQDLGRQMQKDYGEPLDKWLGRQHDRLTYAELERDAQTWDVASISQMADELKKYLSGGIPY